MGLAQVSSRETDDQRLQFIFRIYDMDRDGYISNGELFQVCSEFLLLKNVLQVTSSIVVLLKVLKMMTGKNLTDQQLQQIVDKTIIYLDKDADGKISFEEFKDLVETRGVKPKMSVDASKF